MKYFTLLLCFLGLSLQTYGQGVENSIRFFFSFSLVAGLVLIFLLNKLIVKNRLLKFGSIIFALILIYLLAPNLSENESLSTTRNFIFWPATILFIQLRYASNADNWRIISLFFKTFLLVGAVHFTYGIETGYEYFGTFFVLLVFIFSIYDHNRLILRKNTTVTNYKIIGESIIMSFFLLLAIRCCSYLIEGEIEIDVKTVVAFFVGTIVLAIIALITTIVAIKNNRV